ncbi:MAG: glutamate racemase [Deltaproteobacteria bacterium CG11_big_fil_rev_8_21_14_0_20_47_16]|nr:MAG: glutamate racemase [Deltaproteobacteria bacterium CG11_big_fil_rev_8_21_14_0_20_47_16]
MTTDAPIGIFDSGIGGLTVFRTIRRLLPQESILYVGDTARVPYGNKTAETVTGYSLQIAQWLVNHGAKIVVVACNTSSAVALPALQQSLKVPVIGMIGPGARAAVRSSHTQRIGVIGTARTIASAAYDNAIQGLAAKAVVASQACPLLVSLVEEGWLSGPIAESVVRRYLEPLQKSNVDTVILGCTHYPLLAPVIQDCLGSSVTLIDSGEAAAEVVAETLVSQNLLASPAHKPQWQCGVTDMPAPFAEIAHRFLDSPLPQIRHVHLE